MEFQLQPEHAQKIHDAVAPFVGYLARLRSRMDKVGFVPDDPLRQSVERAYDAAFDLCVKMHYRACGQKEMAMPQPVAFGAKDEEQ
jgi:hypothetical protein